MNPEKPTTESVEIYPAGRGKVLVITKKHMPKKTNQYKRKNPSFVWFNIKSNPDNIALIEYLNDGKRATYLFPEGIEISREKALELSTVLYLRSLDTGKTMNMARNKRFRVSQEFKIQAKKQARRYNRWRMKQQ